MPDDDTSAGDLDEAERLVRQFAETGQHPGRPAVAAVLAEYDRRAQEIEQLAYERDGALARVAAAEAVQSRMADSLPDQGPWELWGHRDRAVRDYEGELSDALAVEVDPRARKPLMGPIFRRFEVADHVLDFNRGIFYRAVIAITPASVWIRCGRELPASPHLVPARLSEFYAAQEAVAAGNTTEEPQP